LTPYRRDQTNRQSQIVTIEIFVGIFVKLFNPEIPGVCKVANQQHAGDLPMLNGIKEDIKSLLSFEAGTSLYQEALLNLSQRLKNLQVYCASLFYDIFAYQFITISLLLALPFAFIWVA
jgi:hypothetical protein